NRDDGFVVSVLLRRRCRRGFSGRRCVLVGRIICSRWRRNVAVGGIGGRFFGGGSRRWRSDDQLLLTRCEPDVLTARTAQRTAVLVDHFRLYVVGRGAAWTGKEHGRRLGPGGESVFRADPRHESVNGSETIRTQMLSADAWGREVNGRLTGCSRG